MATLQDVLRIHRIEKVELTAWIERRWLRPRETAAGPEFDEVDQARILLIRELRDDLSVNEDALDMVLSLLDQLYAARCVLHSVNQAVAAMPESLRAEIRARLPHSE